VFSCRSVRCCWRWLPSGRCVDDRLPRPKQQRTEAGETEKIRNAGRDFRRHRSGRHAWAAAHRAPRIISATFPRGGRPPPPQQRPRWPCGGPSADRCWKARADISPRAGSPKHRSWTGAAAAVAPGAAGRRHARGDYVGDAAALALRRTAVGQGIVVGRGRPHLRPPPARRCWQRARNRSGGAPATLLSFGGAAGGCSRRRPPSGLTKWTGGSCTAPACHTVSWSSLSGCGLDVGSSDGAFSAGSPCVQGAA